MGRFNRGRVVWSRRGCLYLLQRYLMTIGRGGGKSEGGVVCLFEESCGVGSESGGCFGGGFGGEH